MARPSRLPVQQQAGRPLPHDETAHRSLNLRRVHDQIPILSTRGIPQGIGDYVDLCNGVEDIMTNSEKCEPSFLPPPLSTVMRDITAPPSPSQARRITGPGLVIYAAG